MKTYCIEMFRGGRWLYVGKVEATFEAIRREWPRAAVEGNTVRLFSSR